MVGLKPPEVPPTAAMKFVSAGVAGCIADLCTFPLDTAKVRLQIQGEVRIPRSIGTVEYRGVLGTLSTMVRTEGPRSLYSGLAAGLQRQMSFASIRIGLYDSVKQLYTPKGAESTGLAARVLAGCTTGAVAVTCAQPTDVVKVRFQANGVQPDGVRRYSGTMDAYRTIAREEGVRGLWRGRGGWGQGWDGNRDEEGARDEMGMGTARLEHPSGMLQEGMRLPSPMPPPSHAGTLPNIARNAIINCGELVTYDLIKDALLRAQLMTDNVPCHFVAAFGAGFCATVVASPVDVVKTRYMNAGPGQYRNVLSCFLALLMQDGLAGFYKGFVPSFLRLGSWNVVMFVSYEQLQRVAVLARPVQS
ncbi:mitochondrial uncoupling protein 3-like isoform X2 [Accipiter gentilis]|nr:mitochondrial uncoupling protein 3-like isoform X2 [Accipiter gentilis]XP_049678920.1 mitochondrial uncoupling protein 3-like isoform X2 [Accipiter gentilis]